MRELAFIVPGDLATRTGGYAYDRKVIAELGQLGWNVHVRELDASFPLPTTQAKVDALAVLSSLPEESLVIVDGLAYGAMPDVVARFHNSHLKFVALVHHPLALESGLDAQQSGLLRGTEQRALQYAEAVIVTSAATRHALADYAVDDSLITIAEPGTEAAPLARGSNDRVPHLLCVATLIPRKGYDVLLAALADLKHLGWKLTCIGGPIGDEAIARDLEAQVARAGLGDRVTFRGEGDDAIVAAAYDAADLFVLATRYEGYGMVVAEALARGLPVISTRTGGIAGLVGEDAGLIVKPDSVTELKAALARVLNEPALLQRLRAGAASRRLALPSWHETGRKISGCLERITAS